MHNRAFVYLSFLSSVVLTNCGRPTSLDELREPKRIADVYVAPPATGGDDANAGRSSTAPLATIAAAVEVASRLTDDSGPVEIAIAMGQYEGTVTIPPGRSVALRGGYDNTDPFAWGQVGHASSTVIRGEPSAAVLVSGGASVILTRLHLIGGDTAVAGMMVLGNQYPVAGGLVVAGGTASVDECELYGGDGGGLLVRAGVVADAGEYDNTSRGSEVTISRSTLIGGKRVQFSSGLFCGKDSYCTVRDNPLIDATVTHFATAGDDQWFSAGIEAAGATSVVVTGNEVISASGGHNTAGIHAIGVDEVHVDGNALIEAGLAVSESAGIVTIACPEVILERNGEIRGGTSEMSFGLQLQQSSGIVRDNGFIEGGAAVSASVGAIVYSWSSFDLDDNVWIAGGTGFRTVGVQVFSSAGARVRRNLIDGGQADFEAFGVHLSRSKVQSGTLPKTLVQENDVFAGTGEHVVGLVVEDMSPVIINNVFRVTGGVTVNYGTLLSDTGTAAITSPLLALNTFALLVVPECLAALRLGAGIVDANTSALVMGNLIGSNIPSTRLLWLTGANRSGGGYEYNAFFHESDLSMCPFAPPPSFLLLIGDPGDDLSLKREIPTISDSVAQTADLGVIPWAQGNMMCRPAWRERNIFQGTQMNVHLGSEGCPESSSESSCPPYNCSATTCVDVGPDLGDIVAAAADLGITLVAADLVDIDGEPRLMGAGVEVGADEVDLDDSSICR